MRITAKLLTNLCNSLCLFKIIEAKNIVKSLNNLGHFVTYADPKADIQINFTQPQHFKMHRKQYQIGYTPWESTSMRPDWVERFNHCDEVWTTSDWCAKVFKDNGITKPIYVYPHGIEDFWVPKRRVVNEGQPIKFLHIGEPSPRKDGQLVVDTFAKIFGNNPDYQLTLKCHNSNTTRMYNKNNEFVTPDTIYSNIKIILFPLSSYSTFDLGIGCIFCSPKDFYIPSSKLMLNMLKTNDLHRFLHSTLQVSMGQANGLFQRLSAG